MEKQRNTIKVIVKEPGKAMSKERIPNTLEAFQKVVGGPIEALRISWKPEILLICNEEGKISGLTPNFILRDDIIVGPAVFCGVREEEFADCPVDTSELVGIIPCLQIDG